MKENMNQGYYSIIQYVDDLYLMESVAIGVFLLNEETGACAVHYAENMNRVRDFFGVKAAEYVNSFLSGVAFRMIKECRNLQALQNFVSTRANNIRLTDPRSIGLESSLDAEITELSSKISKNCKKEYSK
jgi:hypothetical protein